MALRFTLSPQVARHLSFCPAPVRQRLLGELLGVLSVPPARPASAPEEGRLRLSLGFLVGYRLDRARECLELLTLSGPGRFDPAPLPV